MYFLNSSPKIVLVTGANQGLGLGVIEVAGIRNPNNTFILGSRDLEKGNLAVKQLHEAGVTAKVEVIQLEVTNNEHITAAVRYVQETYGKLDGKSFHLPRLRSTVLGLPRRSWLY